MPKIPNELLSNSDKLESQANQAALKDSKVFKGFNCRKSLQRQPAEIACRDTLQKSFQMILKESKRFQRNPKYFKKIQKMPRDSKRF